jgi:hypothetical protein
MAVEYRRLVPTDADLLAEFLTGEDWPYFAGGPGPDADRIREQVAAGRPARSRGPTGRTSLAYALASAISRYGVMRRAAPRPGNQLQAMPTAATRPVLSSNPRASATCPASGPPGVG